MLGLLAPGLGLSFDAVSPDVEELVDGDPAELVVANALEKARAGASMQGAGAYDAVLGVDTDVVLDGVVLGKPGDPAGARERIRALAGRTHHVLSGVALLSGEDQQTELVATDVTFRSLGAAEVDAYVASGEWEGRAGGYAVQGLGASLVTRIDGDLSNVIGLPVPAFTRMVEKLQNR